MAEPPSTVELEQVEAYRRLRELIHNGPMYTVAAISGAADAGDAAAHFDPFEGMPTFTAQYKKGRQTLPRLDTHELSMQLEWTVLA